MNTLNTITELDNLIEKMIGMNIYDVTEYTSIALYQLADEYKIETDSIMTEYAYIALQQLTDGYKIYADSILKNSELMMNFPRYNLCKEIFEIVRLYILQAGNFLTGTVGGKELEALIEEACYNLRYDHLFNQGGTLPYDIIILDRPISVKSSIAKYNKDGNASVTVTSYRLSKVIDFPDYLQEEIKWRNAYIEFFILYLRVTPWGENQKKASECDVLYFMIPEPLFTPDFSEMKRRPSGYYDIKFPAIPGASAVINKAAVYYSLTFKLSDILPFAVKLDDKFKIIRKYEIIDFRPRIKASQRQFRVEQ